MHSTSERFMRLARLIFMVVALAQTSYALSATPKGNVTVNAYGEATFASEPHGRGTVGILLSCTATFIFCVWTAVHPNVVPGVKPSQRLYYKGALMVISILVPEGLVVCAIGEFREARRLVKAWNECPKIPERYKSQMDMRVAFFVVMGGFIVDENVITGPDPPAPEPGILWKTGNFFRRLFCIKEKERPPAPPKSLWRARLTPTGFKTYMEEGLIHEQSFRKADILDKGKASTIGKFLAAIQALWLVVQSVSRASAGLPLSLLEIHVLIHVARTALIYSFWWFKPLDVNEPIRIYLDERVEQDQEIKSSDPVCNKEVPRTEVRGVSSFSHHPGISPAYHETLRGGSPSHDSTFSSIASQPGSRVGSPVHRESVISFVTSPIGERVRSPAPTPPAPPLENSLCTKRSDSDMLREDYHKDPLHGRFGDRDRLLVEIEHSKKYRRNEPKFITSQSPQSFILFHNKAVYDIIIHMDVGDREGREENSKGFHAHTKRAIEANRSMNMSRSVDHYQPESQRRPGNRAERAVVSNHSNRMSMVHIPEAKDALRFSFVMFCESVLICLTGVLHALAWNKHFPTSIERWLWRGSSLTMCACCLGLFLIANFTEYEQDLIATMWKFHIGLKPDDGFFRIVRKGLSEIHNICVAHAKKSKGHPGLRYILHQCGVGLALLFVTIYFFSVSYITVESYLSLREAPPDMWLTASWTDYWPHL